MHNSFDLNNFNVLVIGDLMLDRYLYGNINRISPEAPVPILEKKGMEDKPGGAANVALNIKSLGSNALLLGITGTDEESTLLLELLNKKGIDNHYIIKTSDRPTTVKTRVMASGQHVLRIDEEFCAYIDEETELQLRHKFDDILKNINLDAVIFQDYNKGLLSCGLISHIIEKCRENNIFTAVDPKFHNFMCYKNSDFFKPNLKELSMIINKNVDPDPLSLNEAAIFLRDKLNYKNMFVTLGDKGIFYCNESISELATTEKRTIVDVSGAGDVVISVATLLFLMKLEIAKIAEISNVAGGLACEELGVATISKEQLISALKY
jgi:rfaE bifunctional protein kinase chain/domain